MKEVDPAGRALYRDVFMTTYYRQLSRGMSPADALLQSRFRAEEAASAYLLWLQKEELGL